MAIRVINGFDSATTLTFALRASSGEVIDAGNIRGGSSQYFEVSHASGPFSMIEVTICNEESVLLKHSIPNIDDGVTVTFKAFVKS